MLSCVMFDTFICFPVSLSSISDSIMQANRFPNQLLHVNFETCLVLLSCSWEYISPLVSIVLFPFLFIYSMGLEMRDIYAAGNSWSHVNKPGGDRITLLLPSVSVYIMVR